MLPSVRCHAHCSPQIALARVRNLPHLVNHPLCVPTSRALPANKTEHPCQTDLASLSSPPVLHLKDWLSRTGRAWISGNADCTWSAPWLTLHMSMLLLTFCLVATPALLTTPVAYAEYEEDNMQNVPSSLQSGEQDGSQRLSSLLSGELKPKIEECVRKCMPTCVRGGGNGGAPGLGPISLRKEMVVFKDGFRSRKYCLSECANVCSVKVRQAAAAEAPAKP